MENLRYNLLEFFFFFLEEVSTVQHHFELAAVVAGTEVSSSSCCRPRLFSLTQLMRLGVAATITIMLSSYRIAATIAFRPMTHRILPSLHRRQALHLLRGGATVSASASSSSSSSSFSSEVVLEWGGDDVETLKAAPSLIIIGSPQSLETAAKGLLDSNLLEAMVGSGKSGDAGKVTSTYDAGGATALRHVSLVQLPSVGASRHNAPSRPDAVTALLSSALSAGPNAKSEQAVHVAAVLESESDRHAVTCAIGKAFPRFSMKSTPSVQESNAGAESPSAEKVVRVSFIDTAGQVLFTKEEYTKSAITASAIRRAQELVDLPPEMLNVDGMVAEAVATANRLNALRESSGGGPVTVQVLRGEELLEKGYGGIWGVGKAAKEPPALVVLSYEPVSPSEDTETVAWVGKGIVYDTGGLSLKVGGGMVGMKSDMGGAAAMLAAFEAAVQLGTPQRLHLLLCLAENAIGPGAFRNDDILKVRR